VSKQFEANLGTINPAMQRLVKGKMGKRCKLLLSRQHIPKANWLLLCQCLGGN
jgi:hypothetical protein